MTQCSKSFLALLGFLCLAPTSEVAALPCDIHFILNGTVPPVPNLQIDLKPITANLESLNRQLLNEVKNGVPYSYYVDTLDHIHFVKGDQLLEGNGIFLAVKDKASTTSYVIKESGTIVFDAEKKKFVFEPKKGWDLAPEETNKIIGELEEGNPGLAFTRKPNPNLDRAKTISCLEILSQVQSGNTFVWDSIVSSNVVSMAGVVTQELSGNHMITDPDKRKLMYADLISNNISTLITSPIVKKGVVSNASMVKDFAVRTGSDYITNVAIKRPLYDAMTGGKKSEKDKEKESIGKKLVPYDTGFGVVRFFPKRALDKALMNQIPQLMINSCLNGNPIVAKVGPKMIRIADRYSWGLIYLWGRNIYLENQK